VHGLGFNRAYVGEAVDQRQRRNRLEACVIVEGTQGGRFELLLRRSCDDSGIVVSI